MTIIKKNSTGSESSSELSSKSVAIVESQYLRQISGNNLKNVRRAGVIVYTVYEKKLLFALGIDNDSGDICDFGGKYDGRLDYDGLDTAIREFTEESLSSFGIFDRESLKNCACSFNGTNLMIFLPLDVIPQKIDDIFIERMIDVDKPEIKKIKWFDLENLKLLIKGLPSRSLEDRKVKNYNIYNPTKRMIVPDVFEKI